MSDAVRYRFGDCELDPERAELRRGGERVAIQPKPLELLVYLLRNRERVVGKRELLDALWPDAVVTESSLTKAVSVARRAIGDRGTRARLQSVARRGYRFTGDVVELSAEAAPSGAPLGGRRGADAFVGRAEPLARLRAAFERAAGGEGVIALVSGEAGVGKTRLVEQLVAELAGRGACVGRARGQDGEGAPPFWLWAELLRALAEHAELGREVPELASGFEVADLVPAGEVEASGDVERARFELFDRVARILRACARRRPLVLVLDDLQWAGRGSQQLLEQLAPAMAREPVLLLATIREEHREPGHPLNRTLALLGRLDHVVRVELGGFSRDEVAELLEAAIGRAAPGQLVDALMARTEGNPLFLREALRLLRDAGQLDAPERTPRWSLERLPERTFDVVRRHLESLPEPCLRLVEAAAVLGREFRVPLVAELAERPRDEALDLLDEAVRAGVLQASEGRAGYRFAHPLFGEAAYAHLAPGRRARLHLRAADALEGAAGAERAGVLSELAQHLHRALAVCDPERAYRAALEAARHAQRLLAYEKAALHYEQARDALESAGGANPELRLALLLELGRAHRFAGDRTRRREVLREALALARELGRADEFAQAAVAFCDMGEWAPDDDEGRRVVAEALERLPADARTARIRLSSRLAYMWRQERERSEAPAREALEQARALGEPEPLQEALYALHLIVAGPDGYDERERLTAELAELAPRASYSDLAHIALLDVASDRISRGDLAGARALRARAEALAGPRPHRSLVWHQQVFDVGLLLLLGRFAEAEAASLDCAVLGRLIEHPGADMVWVGQTVYRLRDQGRLAELPALAGRELGGRVVPMPDQGPHSRALLGGLPAHAGDLEAARARLPRLLGPDPRELPRGIDWLVGMAELAWTVALLREQKPAAVLQELLEPYAELHVTIPLGICYIGPVSRFLGLLHEARGELQAAEARLAEALEACPPEARPVAARLRVELGRVRLARGRAGAALVAEGRAEAEALGMAALAEEARRLTP